VTWWAIRSLGGYTAAPLLGGGYGLPPPVSSLSHNLSMGGQALLTLFGADFLSHPAGLAWLSILLHLGGLALVVGVLAFLLRPRCWLALDLVSRILALGMLVDAAAYIVGQQATDLTSARYLLPLLGFGAVLAGREGVPRLMAVRPRLWLGGLALGAAYAGVFAAAAVTAQPAPDRLAVRARGYPRPGHLLGRQRGDREHPRCDNRPVGKHGLRGAAAVPLAHGDVLVQPSQPTGNLCPPRRERHHRPGRGRGVAGPAERDDDGGRYHHHGVARQPAR
jgi:hypothetical protein